MARKTNLKQRRAARGAYQSAAKKPLGEGSRFKAVEESARAGGAREPEAVAASVMWKKYGKKGGAAIIKKGKAKK